MDNPQKIEDIDGPLLADLRNKLGPVYNLLAILKICDGITYPWILKEIEESKEVIKLICKKK